MSSPRLRVLRAAFVLPVPLVVLLALARPHPAAPATPAPANPAPEPALLARAHADTFAFFDEGRAQTDPGRSLFATDFFKPPPPPPAPPSPPKPPPPPPKLVSASYRGFAAFPSGAASVAYLSVDGRVVTLSPGDPVAEGWKLLSFDADAAELARDEARFRLPFNKPVSLPAKPAQPAP